MMYRLRLLQVAVECKILNLKMEYPMFSEGIIKGGEDLIYRNQQIEVLKSEV